MTFMCACVENVTLRPGSDRIGDTWIHGQYRCVERAPKQEEPSYSDARTLDGGSPTPGVEDVVFGRKERCVEARCERTYSVVVPSSVPHLCLVPGGWWVNGRGLFWCPEHRCRSLSYREWSRSDEQEPEMSTFAGGGMREPQGDRPRFELLWPKDVPYDEQMLTRFASHMARGAEKYESRNWEQFSDQAALDRAESSLLRHVYQWLAGDTSEDHAAAIMFNVMCAEHVKRKLTTTRVPSGTANTGDGSMRDHYKGDG